MRKLATACTAFSLAVFLAYYCIPASVLPGLAGVAALLGVLLLLTRRQWLRPAVISLLFFALGLGWYALYCHMTVEKARSLAGQTRTLSAVVLDEPERFESYCRLRVRLEDGELPRFKAVLYDDKSCLASVRPGQRIRFTAALRTADTLYGEPYANYNIDGYYLKLNMKGQAELLESPFRLSCAPARLRHALCRRVDQIIPADVRAFVKALMLGEKDEFYADDALYVSMSRAGLMHVVAVSGLHLSYLTALVLLALGRGRRGALVSILLSWGFVLLTGGSKSVLRAAIMQNLVLLAPIVRRENDPATTLSFALALLLGFNPLAAGSVGLQLSFGAVAGLFLFYGRLYGWLSRHLPDTRALRYAAGVAASTLSVTVVTMPLTALHFSYIQLLSVLTNLACLWAVSLCFCGAWIACALSLLPAAGTAAAWVCAWLARYIRLCARLVSAIPYSVLYTSTRGAWLWLLVSYGLVLLGLLLRRRRGLRVLLPASLSLALLAGVIAHAGWYYRSRDLFSVLDVGQGQCVCAFAGDKTVMVDCGNINALEDAGAAAGEYLAGCGRRRVDLLLLTHLHTDHADGVRRLLELIPVEKLVLPVDAGSKDTLRAEILSAAARHDTEVLVLDGSAELDIGRVHLRLFRLPGDEKENERCLMARLSIGQADLLVTADAPQKLERALVEREDLRGTDILIAGHHGSKNACCEELLTAAGGQIAAISVGCNSYGHPAAQTLERLEKHGYTVYRTDLDGTLEIQVKENDG